MKRLLPRAALRVLQGIGQTLDPFFAGRWYWSLKRWTAERLLQHALEKHGDQSMQARVATERYRRSDFAFRYWRPAPGPVMRIAKHAVDAGVPFYAIRLLVLNADLRIRNARVHLRRPVVVTILNAIFATSVGAHMLLMCLMVVAGPGPIWLKISAILLTTFVYSVVYHGWSLFASRPQGVIAKHGHTLDVLCAASAPQSLVEFRNPVSR